MEPAYYTLEPFKGPQWTTAQEKSVSLEYPFDLNEETTEQFVTRTYLQFLWLPQTIMPLQLLVPSLRRVANLPSSSQSPHPLHSLLDSLLQTTRAITKKYHIELVQILQDGCGAGEMEETMMWYALHNERMDEQEPKQTGSRNQELWMDEKRRQRWLERLEIREIQVQILLYFTKLSLPGPTPETSSQPRKRKRSRKEAHAPPASATPAERLESFMDKLSMLQLTSRLGTNGRQVDHNEKDWAQSFCEDIVETLFKPLLPDLCSLLRSKVFPDSPFSDTDAMTASRSPSPSPIDSQVDTGEPTDVLTTNITSQLSSRSLARARSRSLSVTLAQEKEDRQRSVSIGPGKKRLLNREVSMSRAFKAKPKALSKATENSTSSRNRPNGKSQLEKDEVILVEDTPQKPRAANTTKTSRSRLEPISSSYSVFGSHHSTQGLFGSGINNADDDDDAWMLDSSPEVLLLQPRRKGAETSDDEYETATFQTPSKKPRPSRMR